jgi:hypothetical protein
MGLLEVLTARERGGADDSLYLDDELERDCNSAISVGNREVAWIESKSPIPLELGQPSTLIPRKSSNEKPKTAGSRLRSSRIAWARRDIPDELSHCSTSSTART